MRWPAASNIQDFLTVPDHAGVASAKAWAFGARFRGGFLGIVSFAGGYVNTTSAWGDLQAWNYARGVTAQQDIDLGTSLTNSLSDAAINRAQGQVSLASQAAAKRLGISLPGSSTSTSSSSTPATNPTSSVTVKRVSGVVNSRYGNDYVAQSMTGTLATINGIISGSSKITSVGTKALSSYGSNYAAQNITGYLANLDRINATPITPPVNVTA